MEELLRFATALARDAGRLAARLFADGTTATEKDDGTEVTAADVEVERFLRARIAAAFPDDAIHGEEEGESAGRSGRRWVLDPINGTSLFVRRIPTFTLLLAVEDAEGPAVGLIGFPVTGELFFAARGLGCWRQVGDGPAERLRVSVTARRRGATAEMVNPVTWSEELLVALHRELFVLPVMKGAAGVVTGMTDAVVIAGFPMGYEDLAPLPVLVGEAGGRVTDLSGGDVLTGDGSALVSNGVLHDDLLALVAGIPHGRDLRAAFPR